LTIESSPLPSSSVGRVFVDGRDFGDGTAFVDGTDLVDFVGKVGVLFSLLTHSGRFGFS